LYIPSLTAYKSVFNIALTWAHLKFGVCPIVFQVLSLYTIKPLDIVGYITILGANTTKGHVKSLVEKKRH
jgi:hypothetical protein